MSIQKIVEKAYYGEVNSLKLTNFYLECLRYDKPTEGILELFRNYGTDTEFIIYTLYSNKQIIIKGTSKELTTKVLKKFHHMFGDLFIQILTELSQCDDDGYAPYGDFFWQCYKMFGIHPKIETLLANNVYPFLMTSIEFYEDILHYLHKQKIDIIPYAQVFLIRSERHLEILSQYLPIEYYVGCLVQLWHEKPWLANMKIIKKYFYIVPHYSVARICARNNKNLDGEYYQHVISETELCVLYKTMHAARKRKLELLTKWLRIKLACRRIRIFLPKCAAKYAMIRDAAMIKIYYSHIKY